MNNLDLQDFLSLSLSKTANWRRQQALKWPQDTRNAVAAERLFALAAQAGPISDDACEVIRRAFDPRDDRFCQIVSDASRGVGFRTSPRTFEAYAQTIADALVVA
jgi:hypothetical protein